MPSRKQQPKRKHGCKTCKSRKVRCDLARPICNNCTRLDRVCIYETELKPPPRAVQTNSTSSISLFGVLSLRLMHHYTESACFSMSDNPGHIRVWQHDVPQIAFERIFVLHGILALSALHLRTGATKKNELLQVANDHQEKALAEFIPLLSSINEENCHALFAFAFLVGNVSYALLERTKILGSERAFINSLLSVFDLLKGTTVVAVRARVWLRGGPLAKLMDDEHPLLDQHKGSESLPLSIELQALIHYIELRQGRSDSANHLTHFICYRTSIEKLNVLASPTLHPMPKIAAVTGWPVFLQAEFLTMLRDGDPAALVILAHYGMILQQLNNVWYLEGLGTKLVASVVAMVSQEWKPFLRGPIEAVLE